MAELPEAHDELATQPEKHFVLYPCDPLTDPAAIDVDGDLLAPDKTKLLLLMVCEVPQESLSWFRKNLMPPAQLRRQVAAREVELQERIYEVSKYLAHLGYEVDTKVERGKTTGDVIIQVAKEAQVDFIVMKRRRQKPWQRFLLGSVVDYVAKRATRPLVILPPAAL